MKKLLAMISFLLIAQFGFAQNMIRGTVYDSQLEPLAGVSVLVEGTTVGTITDADGNYPSPNNPTVYLDTEEIILDLLYRGNGDALKWLLINKQAYYKAAGTWYSETITDDYTEIYKINFDYKELYEENQKYNDTDIMQSRLN